MKHPTGNIRPRRMAAPKKKVRLDLKRRPQPAPEDDLGTEQKNHFWKWVGLVALFHVIVILIVFLLYETGPAKPPEQFISLLPEGNLVKGTPGAQQAHKVGATSRATPPHQSFSPPVTSAPSKPLPLAPPIHPQPRPSLLALEKPTPKPSPPKVKVDLTLADGPASAETPKLKVHHKKPTPKPIDNPADAEPEAEVKPESPGLSKEQIAEKLGEKSEAAGTQNAVNSGTSGSVNGHANRFADFYAMITQQINDQWKIPNVAAEMPSNPLVHIYVERDGRVDPESVHLVRSSGNSAYDDSAVSTAKNLGYLHEPLPEGCPPDISIDFKPDR